MPGASPYTQSFYNPNLLNYGGEQTRVPDYFNVSPTPQTNQSSNPFGYVGSGLMDNPTQTGLGGLGGVDQIGLNPNFYSTPGAAQSIAQALGGSAYPVNYGLAGQSPDQWMVGAQTGAQLPAGNLAAIYNNPIWNDAQRQAEALQVLNNYYPGGQPQNAVQGTYSFQNGQFVYNPNGQAPQAGPWGANAMPTQGLPLNFSSGFAGLLGWPADQQAAAFNTQYPTPQNYTNPATGQWVGLGTPSPYVTLPNNGANLMGNGLPSTPNPYNNVAAGQQGTPWAGPQYTPPPAPQAAVNPLQQTSAPQATPYTPGVSQGENSPNWLSDIYNQGGNPTSLMGNLQNIIQGQGNPINQVPAWQSMIEAQQRNIDKGAADLAEQFNVSGNRFSSAFGTAATDYQNQATREQNALLAQMQNQALEAAAGRKYGASSLLDQLGLQAGEGAAGRRLQAGGQLSGQDFQSQQQQYNIAAQMAALLAQQSGGAAGQLAQLGAGAAGQLYGGSLAGAQGLWGAENQAAQGMYGAQNQLLPQFMQQDLLAQQLGLQGAGQLSNLWNQNLQTGAQLGGQQYGYGQNAINNAYQEWLRTQAMYNPLLQTMYSASTYYPSPVFPGYQPGALSSMMGGAGSMLGGIAGLAMLSDERVKRDVSQIGEVAGLPVYKFKYLWDDRPHVGFMAQEVEEVFPDSVINLEGAPKMVNVGSLLQHFKEL